MAKYPGLLAEEAMHRLSSERPNVLPESRKRFYAVMVDALKETMFLLLIAVALLYLLLGDLHEGLLLFVMVGVTIGLTLYQEGKTERALVLRDRWATGPHRRVTWSEATSCCCPKVSVSRPMRFCWKYSICGSTNFCSPARWFRWTSVPPLPQTMN